MSQCYFFLHKSHNVITGVSFLSAIFQCTVKCDVDEDIMFFFLIFLYTAYLLCDCSVGFE